MHYLRSSYSPFLQYEELDARTIHQYIPRVLDPTFLVPASPSIPTVRRVNAAKVQCRSPGRALHTASGQSPSGEAFPEKRASLVLKGHSTSFLYQYDHYSKNAPS